MTIAHADRLVREEQREQYVQEGYFILPGVMPRDVLEMLREECSYFLGYADAVIDHTDQHTPNHRDQRYFISNQYRFSHRLQAFLFGDLMAAVAEATVGPTAYLLHEQWVVKGPERGMSFAWHQDSAYIRHEGRTLEHKPYVTCWCPLDDVNEENGTVYLLPHARGGTGQRVVAHTARQQSTDLVGYHGQDPGIPIIAPAGSIVAFSSLVLHRSGANASPRMRRVYLPQYSSQPVTLASGRPWAMAVPFLEGGRRVYDRAGDTATNHGPESLVGKEPARAGGADRRATDDKGG